MTHVAPAHARRRPFEARRAAALPRFVARRRPAQPTGERERRTRPRAAPPLRNRTRDPPHSKGLLPGRLAAGPRAARGPRRAGPAANSTGPPSPPRPAHPQGLTQTRFCDVPWLLPRLGYTLMVRAANGAAVLLPGRMWRDARAGRPALRGGPAGACC
ncbi:MAG: hypothetical protein J3K34DRAFT_410429, partial [Monoraphidium minutum]